MLNEFIYNNPTWLWSTWVLASFVVAACGGLVIFQRFVSVDVRRKHNDLAGFNAAIISVVYAVLLAFVAIATWESYTRAEELVENEADLVGSIYRDAQGLPDEMGQAIRGDVRDYIDAVVHKEWPDQQRAETPYEGWAPLLRLHSSIATMRPQTMSESVLEAELLKTLNDLYRARAARLSGAEGHIPDVVWSIILIGGALTTGFTYLFGFEDFRMHLLMTAAVSASLAIVVVLILAMDWPFRGEVSISPAAFERTAAAWVTPVAAVKP